MKKNFIILGISGFLFSGCYSGKFLYTEPTIQHTSKVNNTKTINQSKDSVWKKVVPEIGKTFFSINNIDKESGLINVSYSVNPEQYIDCGRIYSFVENVHGARTYDFAASKAQQMYERLTDGYTSNNRKMQLEGRINIILQEFDTNQTIVTINPKYIVTLTNNVTWFDGYGNRNHIHTDTISFNSNDYGTFNGGTKCISNGRLEQEILNIFKD